MLSGQFEVFRFVEQHFVWWSVSSLHSGQLDPPHRTVKKNKKIQEQAGLEDILLQHGQFEISVCSVERPPSVERAAALI